MTCGIYMIQNKVNGKIYIGQAVDIERRWRKHKSGLRGNYHDNIHLQRAWNKDGETNFEFTIICECAESQLNTMEIDYITKLKTYDPDFGYNKTYGGEGGRPTEETKKKRSESLKGRTVSDETKRKMSESMKGVNNPNYGKHLSEETKNKISEQSKKWWSNDEYRNTIINKSKDAWKDEEYRKKQYEGNLLVHKYDRSTACLCINNGNVYKSVGDIYEELGRNKGDTSIYTAVRLNSKFEENQFKTFKFRSFKGNYYMRYDVWSSLSPECRNYLKTNIDSLNKNRIG